jgi:hypothetical protein
MEEKRPFWLEMDGGDTVQFLDQVYRMKASGAQTGGLFSLVEVSTPQGSGPPPHVHEREDEAFYVLEGSYEVTVGDGRLGPGSSGDGGVGEGARRHVARPAARSVMVSWAGRRTRARCRPGRGSSPRSRKGGP